MTDAERDQQAAARVRAAAAKSTEDYVRVAAGDLAALHRVAGAADSPLGRHAAAIAGEDAATKIGVHRDRHLADLLAKVPA